MPGCVCVCVPSAVGVCVCVYLVPWVLSSFVLRLGKGSASSLLKS